MEVVERGFRFSTRHVADGNVAHVFADYERRQTQAPIRRTQTYEMEFFGRGAGMVLGVTAIARLTTPGTVEAARRRKTRVALAAASTTSPASATTAVSRTVQPDVRSPFGENDLDSELPPSSLRVRPVGPGGGGTNTGNTGGGGGGGGVRVLHGAVIIELFIFGATQPVQTWLLNEEVGPLERQVEFEIPGFPSPDSPMLRLGWWRMVVRPISAFPVEIAIFAHVRLNDVPIRTTPLPVRLTNHLFRVGLEALVPQVSVGGTRAQASIGSEIAELVGIAPKVFSIDIDPLTSQARLRSLNITTISGAEFHQVALSHWRAAVRRVFGNLGAAATDQKVAVLFAGPLARLSQVQEDFVCIRIQAAFSDADVSVHGFDVASLRGELGELVLAFDRSISRLLPFSFLDVDFSTIAEIAIPIINLFTEVPSDVNQLIELYFFDIAVEQPVRTYLREFLARAVGLHSTVHGFNLQNRAWQILHSDDPVIPRPGDPTLPPVGPNDGGGVIGLFERRGVFRDRPAPVTELEPAIAAPAAVARPAAGVPPGFLLPPAEKLALLDRHKSIVVVMMENRSYDHMLGDLMNARPSTDNPYDGAPGGIQNAGVAGFIRGVPTVRTRELLLGTQIPVSPRHDFRPVLFQIGDGTAEGAGTGDMQGFARDLYNRTDSPQLALTVYGQQELGIYYALADEFCVCDRWFAAHPGPTWPNRFATIMGRIPELDNFEIDDPRIGFIKDRNIFDALTGAGIEWRVFESDLSLVRMFDRYRLDATRVVPLEDRDVGLEATLRNRSAPLPRVMFVEPNFADIPPLKTADDDHPPADLKHGQQFIARVCDLLWDTGRFKDTLLVITYDEHGGFYDHVPPPGTPKGDPKTFAPLIEGGPTHLGVRVPAFVVSPHVQAHQISRTIFDHTSILKTILVHNRDLLSANTLASFGQRVAEANDLSAVMELVNPRQDPVPFVRRQGRKGPTRFGNLVDLATVLELSSAVTDDDGTTPPVITPPTEATADTGDGPTPRRAPLITERTVPEPAGPPDRRDYHAALAGMLKPRKSG